MRIAAGIILIVAAIVNIFGGAGYVLGGGLATLGDAVVEEANKELVKEGAVTEEEAAKTNQAMAEAMAGVKDVGGLWLFFGLFLWLLFVLQIVGAVFLFIGKQKTLIFIVAALSIAAEVVGLTNVGFVFWQLFGLVGGVLAFIGAAGIGKPEGAPAAPAA